MVYKGYFSIMSRNLHQLMLLPGPSNAAVMSSSPPVHRAQDGRRISAHSKHFSPPFSGAELLLLTNLRELALDRCSLWWDSETWAAVRRHHTRVYITDFVGDPSAAPVLPPVGSMACVSRLLCCAPEVSMVTDNRAHTAAMPHR